MGTGIRIRQIFVEEAGMAAGMAGRAHLIDSGQQGIHIAVAGQGPDILIMPAGIALDPELLPAPGPVGHLSGQNGMLIGLFIHIRDHQHLVSGRVLDNDRQQAVTVLYKGGPGINSLPHADRDMLLLHLLFDAQDPADPVIDRVAAYTADPFHVHQDRHVFIRDLLQDRDGLDPVHTGDLMPGGPVDAVHIVKTADVLQDQLLIAQDRVCRQAAGSDLVPAESGSRFGSQFHIVFSGEIECRLTASGVEQLLDILQPADMAGAGHRDPYILADAADHVDGLVMLRVISGLVKDQQFIGGAVVIGHGQTQRIIVNNGMVPQAVDSPALIQVNTGNKFLISFTHI